MIRALYIVIWLGALVLLLSSIRIGHAETMVSSYYGAESGKRTASGQRFNPEGFTAAHRTLPFGTRLRVCYQGCVTVIVNDRGPFIKGRQLDLAHGAARAIGMLRIGVARITVARL